MRFNLTRNRWLLFSLLGLILLGLLFLCWHKCHREPRALAYSTIMLGDESGFDGGNTSITSGQSVPVTIGLFESKHLLAEPAMTMMGVIEVLDTNGVTHPIVNINGGTTATFMFDAGNPVSSTSFIITLVGTTTAVPAIIEASIIGNPSIHSTSILVSVLSVATSSMVHVNVLDRVVSCSRDSADSCGNFAFDSSTDWIFDIYFDASQVGPQQAPDVSRTAPIIDGFYQLSFNKPIQLNPYCIAIEWKNPNGPETGIIKLNESDPNRIVDPVSNCITHFGTSLCLP